MTEFDRRKLLALFLSLGALGSLTACGGLSDQMTLDEILAMLNAPGDNSSDSDEDVAGTVKLAITYPAGKSPKVFTSGWVFGARCSVDGQDVSDTVKWSGTGTFNPSTGSLSRPVFSSEGANSITLSVTVAGKNYEKTVTVNAVSSSGYAGVGTKAHCPADSHGCPGCPHPTTGPITTGSSNVFVNGRSAARVGDKGVHAACCGPNTFEITSGDPEVLINGRAAAKIGSTTKHCGGSGHIIG